MEKFLKNIKKDLKKLSDKKTKESGKRFFKEDIVLYGVKTPIVQRLAKEYFKDIKDKPKKDIYTLCEELFKSGYMEEAFIACNWSYALKNIYEKKDFYIFKKWVEKYVSNWAVCDTFCNHTVGEFLEKFPEYIKEIKKWTKSKNRWVKRAVAVSFIVPAKKGLFLKDVFEIADIMLEDKDDMVQKGYGWALKAASNKHQKEVFDYVMKNKKSMPRTSLRYAIEKMPENLRQKALLVP